MRAGGMRQTSFFFALTFHDKCMICNEMQWNFCNERLGYFNGNTTHLHTFKAWHTFNSNLPHGSVYQRRRYGAEPPTRSCPPPPRDGRRRTASGWPAPPPDPQSSPPLTCTTCRGRTILRKHRYVGPRGRHWVREIHYTKWFSNILTIIYHLSHSLWNTHGSIRMNCLKCSSHTHI